MDPLENFFQSSDMFLLRPRISSTLGIPHHLGLPKISLICLWKCSGAKAKGQSVETEPSKWCDECG